MEETHQFGERFSLNIKISRETDALIITARLAGNKYIISNHTLSEKIIFIFSEKMGKLNCANSFYDFFIVAAFPSANPINLGSGFLLKELFY